MAYGWVCDDFPSSASPDFALDGRYEYTIEVLSGFPVDTTSKKTRPEYRQTYKWSDTDLISIGRDNCLYANCWSSLSPPRYIYRIWNQASAH